MNNHSVRILKRCATGLLLAAGLGGCAVYGPPYAGDYYDPYYGNGGNNSYYGPPVAVNLGLGYYSSNRRGDYRRDDYRRDGRGHGRPHDGDGRGRGRDRH